MRERFVLSPVEINVQLFINCMNNGLAFAFVFEKAAWTWSKLFPFPLLRGDKSSFLIYVLIRIY